MKLHPPWYFTVVSLVQRIAFAESVSIIQPTSAAEGDVL
jgi:hypothetical protein